MTDPTRVYRIHPDLRRVAAYSYATWSTAGGISLGAGPSYVRPVGGIAIDEAGDAWLGLGVNTSFGLVYAVVQELDRVANGDFAVATQWEYPGAFVPSSVASPDGTDGCATFRTHTAEDVNFEPPGFFAWLDPANAPDPDVIAVDPDEEPFAVAPRLDGSCWAVTRRLPAGGDFEQGGNGQGSVYRLQSSGLQVIDADAFEDVTAASAGPEGSLLVGGRTASCATSIVRYDTSGASPLACVARTLDALAPHPDSGVWAHDAITQELLHVGTDGSVVVTSAVQVVLPQGEGNQGSFFPPGEPRMVADPVERDLWLVQDGQGRLLRYVESGGDLVEGTITSGSAVGETLTRFAAVTLDPGAGHAFATLTNGNYGHLAQVPNHLRRVNEILVTASAPDISIDPTTGDLWIADFAGTGGSPLRRVRPSGRVAFALSHDGPAYGVEAMPDGGAWVALGDPDGTSRLVRLDRDGAQIDEIVMPVARAIAGVSAAPGETHLCTSYGDGFGTPGPLVLIELPSMTIRTDGAGGWASAFDVDASVDGCWFALGYGQAGAVFFDGTDYEYDAIGNSFELSLDEVLSEPVWVSREGEVWTVTNDGIDQGEFHFLANAVASQRRCSPGTCDAGDPLHLWAVRGGNVERVAVTGTALEAFFMPEVGSVVAFDLIP